MAHSFGRDEMNALVGGTEQEEMAAFRPSMAGPQLVKRKRPNEELDLASMTPAETAAHLMQNTKGPSTATSGRYRTNRNLAHHALAEELAEEMQIQASQTKKPTKLEEVEENESEDEFVARGRPVEPQVVRRSMDKGQVGSRRRAGSRTPDKSSSDSSDSENRSRRRRYNRRRQESDDSSSSDDEEDRRRQRLRARRKQEEPTVIVPQSQSAGPASETNRGHPVAESPRNKPTPTPEVKRGKDKGPKPTRLGSDSDSGSEGTSSSSSDSSSEEDSSSSDSSEEEQVIAKPLFVPKHKRNMVQSEEAKWEIEEARQSREKQRQGKRKMESRAMVAQAVAASQASTADEDLDEESGGATNPPPNDDDDVDREKERDDWEVREIARLLAAMDLLKMREKEQLEYQQRRQMTDEEVLEQDKKAGRFQAPGSSQQDGPSGQFMQRFYHRGAYYMDAEEWDQSDVRHKAAEYARAATGEDKVDKKALPEVMQVKKFGFARQNTKYKGLASEDTTDKRLDLLPLVQNKKEKK